MNMEIRLAAGGSRFDSTATASCATQRSGRSALEPDTHRRLDRSWPRGFDRIRGHGRWGSWLRQYLASFGEAAPRLRCACSSPPTPATFASATSCGLRSRATVVVQDAAEPLPALHRCSRISVDVGRRDDRGEQSIVEALVITLEMVMRDKLRDREAEVARAERNELVQALFS